MDDKTKSRTCWIPKVRATEIELSGIVSKAQSHGLTVSDFVRRSCVDSLIVMRESTADKELINSLIAIGNNLNQVAKKANQTNDIEPHLQQRLNATLIQINLILDKLINDPEC